MHLENCVPVRSVKLLADVGCRGDSKVDFFFFADYSYNNYEKIPFVLFQFVDIISDMQFTIAIAAILDLISQFTFQNNHYLFILDIGDAPSLLA